MVLEKTLESPLDCKEIQPVHAKGDQSWIFIGRTDAEAEAPILWPPDAKNWLIWKDPDAGQDWGQEEKGMTEDEMVGWHYWLDGHEFERAPGVGEGQGSLACCSLWGRKESDTTEWLNWLILVPPLVGCVTLGKIPNCSGLFFNLCNHDSNVMYLIGWWTGRPGVLHSMGSQRVGHDWVNELNWTGLRFKRNGVYKALSTLSDFYSKISQSMHIYGLN